MYIRHPHFSTYDTQRFILEDGSRIIATYNQIIVTGCITTTKSIYINIYKNIVYPFVCLKQKERYNILLSTTECIRNNILPTSF